MPAEKLKQQKIPGMTAKLHDEIETKAGEVKELERQRMDIQEQETKAREELKALMEQAGATTFLLEDEEDPLEAVLKTTTKAYVRKRKTESDADHKTGKTDGNGKTPDA